MSVTGSTSSFGSGLDSTTGSEAGPQGRGEEESESTNTFESGLFGSLYTEKAPKWPFVAFRLFMDWLQLFILLVNPAYGWDIDPNNKLWQAFSFIQLNYFMSTRGYTFFLICMYIFAVALASNLALVAWVSKSFQNNSFDHVWPIVVLRYFSLVFYQVLDIASLTLFLMTMDCQYFSVDENVMGYNQEFPDVYCWGFPHLIHVIVAAVAILIFFILASLFTMAEIELNPISHNLMGMPHSRVEVVGFAIKMFMTCVSVFVTGVKWMSVLQLISAFALCYLYLKWLPHLEAVVNHVRVGCYFSVFWAALLLTIMAYHPGLGEHEDDKEHKQQQAFTIALWALFIPAGLVGAAWSWWRTRFYARDVVGMFRDAPADAKPHRIYEFTDAREVEIAARCCRVWIDPDNLDDQAVALAEKIIQVGMKQLPYQPYMAIWWSSFLIDVQGSYQTGYLALQNAKRMPNQSFLERFCIFIRDQEHTQKASAASSGENTSTDLVSYVEFQRNYRVAVHLHMEALIAKRTFWEVLLHHNVTFDKMANAVQRIEGSVRAAERMYKQVLQRHGNSLKILTLYVKFLQGVRNDPWSAARWAAEVEKMQRAEEEANERAVFGEGGSQNGGAHTADDKGVIIVGANCLIRMINEPAAHLFGYQNRAELVGKNISVLIPPPFSRHHNNYIRTYIQTGVTRMMNKARDNVGMHKDRYVVPINTFITKVSGVGDDSVFMGLVQPVPVEPNTGIVWVLQGGKVLSCDAVFSDWLGYKHEDIQGHPLGELVVESRDLEELLSLMKPDGSNMAKDTVAGVDGPTPSDTRKGRNSEVMKPGPVQRGNLTFNVQGQQQQARACKGDPKAVSWTVEGLHVKHLYLESTVAVDVTVTMTGIGDTAMHVFKARREFLKFWLWDPIMDLRAYVAQMHRHEGQETPCLMVTDNKGRVIHVTTKVAERLGSTVARLQAGNTMHALDPLLPAPFVRAAHQWYRERPEVPPTWSCRSGLIVCINVLSSKGVAGVAPFKLNISQTDFVGREPLNVVTLEPRTMDQLLDERRLALTVNSRGIVTSVSDSPVKLFGFEPAALVGLHVSYILDVMQASSALGDQPSPAQVLDAEDAATKLLMLMAQKNHDNPGISWRVGVSPIMDPISLMALGPVGMAMIATTKVPAVMSVQAYLEPPKLEGARMLLPAETQIKMELWRADLLSGVLEVDSQGHVVYAGIKGHPNFNPHLLMGLPPAMITGSSLSQLLPLQGKPMVEALFTEGGLVPVKVTGKAGAATNMNTPGGRGRGGMRAGPQARRRGLGPTHTIKLTHCADGADLELQVNAIVKQDVGAGCSLYIHLHVANPRGGRAEFPAWVMSAPPPSLPFARLATRRSSQLLPGLDTALSTKLPDTAGMRSSFPKELGMALMSEEGNSSMLVPHPPNMQKTMPTVFGIPPPRLAERQSLDHPHTPPKGLPGALEAAENPWTIGSPIDLDQEKDHIGEDADVVQLAQQVLDADLNKNVQFQGEGKPPRVSDASSDSPKKVKAEETRQRIDKWMTSNAKTANSIKRKTPTNRVVPAGLGNEGLAAGNMAVSADPPPPPEEEDEEVEEEEEGGQAGAGHANKIGDPDEEAEIAELDEANSGLNDYKRGKRLKKLAKVLLSPQAQVHNTRLKWVSVAVVMVLIIVDLAMFMTFMSLINVQSSQIDDLRSSSRAVNRVMMVSISTSAIQIILGGKAVPSLRYLGQEGAAKDLAYHLSSMEKRVADLENFHRGVYRGFNKVRELPTDYNLRSIWEDPNLPVRNYLSNNVTTYSQEAYVSLWDAGNDFIRAANNILQTTMTLYNMSANGTRTAGSQAFSNSTDVLYILYNGPRSILSAYQATLDGLMQKAIDDSGKMNVIQLVILAIEGGVVGMSSVILMWFMTARLVLRRYTVFSIFMTVPSGVVRALATVNVALEEGEEDEAQAEGEDQRGGDDRADAELGSGKQQKGNDSGNDHGPTMAAAATAVITTVISGIKTRRKLQASWKAIFLMTWPFMMWACFVIAINVVGFTQLAGMSEPIALSNLVQFMSIRVNRCIFFAQRLTSGQFLDSSFNFTAPDVPPGTTSPLQAAYHNTLLNDYHGMLLEYEAMLFGNQAEAVRNQTSPHFQLAHTGIMYTQGATLMYTYTGCLCQNAKDCLTKDDKFYRLSKYVSHGLDPLLRQFFLSLNSLLSLPADQISLKSPEFEYITETGNADVYGGLSQLIDVYTQEVKTVYSSALTLHVVAFAMCCGLGLMFIVFILRPSVQRVLHESKRVAELLAQLPAETNVENMVMEALRIKEALANAAGAAGTGSNQGNGSGVVDGKHMRHMAASYGSEDEGQGQGFNVRGSGGGPEWASGKVHA